jgi:O-antigen chain-terminating methyltransferase
MLQGRQDDLSARVEQLGRAHDRLGAYQDRFTEEIRAEFGSLIELRAGLAAILGELVEEGREAEAGLALRNELDHTMRRSEDLVNLRLAELGGQLRELRRDNRLTQALLERIGSVPPVPDGPGTAVPVLPAGPAFDHPVPSFDLLYRSFEDRHRGEPADIRERQRADYLDLLGSLPHSGLPIVDLGCGRGELVSLLAEAGHEAIGVDANLSQVIDGGGAFTEADLFQWLDEREDASLRAVVSLHVVEHLPHDLQVRLVFEAHRVLAEGGLLVLETPNTLSLSVAASNFWVDPTHVRPVHPLFLEFLAGEAGFETAETRLLHPVPAHFRGPDTVKELIDDLDSLILGAGDLALVAGR